MNTESTMSLLPTPALVVDAAKLRANIEGMQRHCDAHGVRLWPHIKTHKTIEIARMQLDAGAEGLVCAKLGEAEALLPSGVRRIFLGYPLVDPETQAARLRALSESLETLIVAATSVPQAEALGRVLAAAGITLPVLMAVDTGLSREGVRSTDDALALADIVWRHPNMRLLGLFTHEGHAYRAEAEDIDQVARAVADRLFEVRDALGDNSLPLWPGSSVTAAACATLPGVYAVRPGTYVFGDLSLIRPKGRMDPDTVALRVLTTVVDRPQPDLALMDGGSKTFSSDRTSTGISASAADGRDIHLTRLSEEHGWATGSQVDELAIGERLFWVPAHICPAVNLTDELVVQNPNGSTERWRVAARGRVS